MSRASIYVALSLSFVVGCAGYEPRPSPGPTPPPAPWHPAEVLRAHVGPGTQRTVILDERDGLSPDEAAILAVDRNPRLRAMRSERGIAQAELLKAGILPNPRLEGAIEFPVSGPETTVLGYSAGLSWNVTPLISRGARVSAAQEDVTSVDLEIAWQEWQVAQEARLHALRAIYLSRRAAVVKKAKKAWQDRIAALSQARAAGAVTDLEVIAAQRSLAEAEVNLLELQQSLVAERAALNRALGVYPSKDIALDTSFASSNPAQRQGDLLQGLPRRRLDLIALQHAYRSRDGALRAAALAEFPAIEVGVEMARDVDRIRSAGVTVSVEIPLFDRNQPAVARARAERARVEAEYAARLLDAQADVVRLERQIALVERQLAAARNAAKISDRLAEQARSAAVSGALSPLLSSRMLQDANENHLRALEIEQSLAELRLALSISAGVE